MENLSQNKNKPQTWDQIPKTKWDGLPKKEDVNQLIKENQTLVKSKPLLVIEAIQKRIANELETNEQASPIANIYDLLCHPDILRISYSKVMKNKGALTPGTDPNTTADTFAEKKIQELSLSLKKGKFKWKPVRRIMIEKPGKKEKRPLGLPDFDDKVVQGAISIILEAAYESEFEKLNCNFGFRPNKDTNGAMEKINMEARFFQFAIEGDIKGAYDTIQHEILLEILGKRFTDKKFLRLIQEGLKCGYMLDFIKHETLLGTPQGTICSPTLFNIYMQEFDKFVLNNIAISLQSDNTNLKFKNEINPDYDKFRSRKRKAAEKLKDFQETHNRNLEQMMQRRFNDFFHESPYVKQVLSKNEKIKNALQNFKNNPKIRRQFREIILQNTNETQQEILKKEYENHLISIFQENKQIQKSINYKDPEKLKKKITYVRYADDWIIFVRGTKEDAEKIKNLAAEFLLNNLGLTLSTEKTKITDLYKNNANFLGFEIFYQRNKKNIEVDKGSPNEKVTQRFGTIQFSPDRERLINRFFLKKYITKKGFPREVGFLTILQDHEIINKYNQFMIGLGNYYIRQISSPSKLARWHYILYYSCIKTLAAKHNTTTKNIINNYGYLDLSPPKVNFKRPKTTDLRIIAKYNQNKETKYSTLLNYKEFMFNLLKIKFKYIEEKQNQQPHQLVREADMLTLHKVNFRTAFKETSFCAICGKKEKSLHSHHIRPLKWKNDPKSKAYRGFDKIIAALGRKQIPVCSNCHHKIHSGKYDGMELSELYDIRLVAPEGLLKLDTPKTSLKPINPSLDPIQIGPKTENITIDEYKKTYLNRELQKYLYNKIEHGQNTTE